ncbi:alpha,alpha-trehalase nth1 [Lecanora helva]
MARNAAKAASSLSHLDFVPRRQTRAFAASLQTFTYNAESKANGDVKREDLSGDDSSLSSAASESVFDIEDIALGASPSKKRKRGLDSPSTAVTSVSTVTSTRTSPRKGGVIKGEDASIGKPKKAKRQPAKRIVNEVGEEEVQPPGKWEEVYDAVKEMRKERLAPVDTMGCETLAEEHLTPRDKRFQTLIALMLSSQTKDTTNAIAMRRLQTELPHPGLTLENILEVNPVKLNEMIFVVGFHNNKTRFIKAAAEILRDQFGGDIPDTIEGLISLPGVGPKMAYLCMSAAWGRTEGIGVDVHVHRITNLWGWHKTKQPEETRATLEAWLPREKWHEINHLLVGFGQTTCLPVGRKCGECTLSEKGLCPSAVVEKKVVKRVKKMKKEDEGVKGVEKEELEVAVKEEEVVAEDLK